MKETEKFIEIIFTHDNPDQAREIVRHLVENGLAACGQMIPGLTSIYRWKGKIEETPECKVFLKTRASLCEKVCETIRAMHAYEVPEILVREILSVNPDYTRWLEENTKSEHEA